MKLATAEQVRELDRIAIEERGIPSVQLMENAARGLLEGVHRIAREPLTVGDTTIPRMAAVFVGPGNNGGDGTAVAGLLLQEGWTVRVFLAGSREKLTADHREMIRRFEELGGTVEDYDPKSNSQGVFVREVDIIVDALFGVGINSELRGAPAEAVKVINWSTAPAVSADLPSGVEADTGRVFGDAVRADLTVTFSYAKPGLFVGEGALRAGEVLTWDIGIPADVKSNIDCQVELIDRDMTGRWLPGRPVDGHKGTFGKALIVGGSVGFTGAPVLASRGALRTGAGLVTIMVPQEVWPIVAVKCDEAMARPIPSRQELLAFAKGCDALLVGPGLGRSREAEELSLLLTEEFEGPLVLDADGINALEHHIDILDSRKGRPTVLTPHDGEFARLGGDLSRKDRLKAARTFAVNHGCVLVLKGHNTIVAGPDGRCWINNTGNSGMAKGGSGDVLAGMLLSLLGQGMEPEKAAALAVYLHGYAGDVAARTYTEYGMLPTDLIAAIPIAVRELNS